MYLFSLAWRLNKWIIDKKKNVGDGKDENCFILGISEKLISFEMYKLFKIK